MSPVFPLALVCHQLVIPSCLRYSRQMLFFFPLRNSSVLSFCIKFVFLPCSNLCLVVWSLLLNSVYLSTCFMQTYGSGNLKRVGVFLQRGILILLLACFPCWAVLINTEPILLAVRQSPEVARSVPMMRQNSYGAVVIGSLRPFPYEYRYFSKQIFSPAVLKANSTHTTFYKIWASRWH